MKFKTLHSLSEEETARQFKDYNERRAVCSCAVLTLGLLPCLPANPRLAGQPRALSEVFVPQREVRVTAAIPSIPAIAAIYLCAYLLHTYCAPGAVPDMGSSRWRGGSGPQAAAFQSAWSGWRCRAHANAVKSLGSSSHKASLQSEHHDTPEGWGLAQAHESWAQPM